MALFPKRAAVQKASQQWHQAILRQARQPEPYLQGLVPDTLDGRFQMVTLVATLVLRRLRVEGKDGRALADKVYREVFSGFDHALREEGVGDHSIARKMRARGEEFFGVARAVDAALEEVGGQTLLADVLERNQICDAAGAAGMAASLNDLAIELDQLPADRVMAGQPDW